MQQARQTEGLATTSAIKQRFLLLNRERLRRAQDSMRERQRDFLDLLPLLFHVNHPILPGYVSNECPVGVSDYRPSKRTLHAVKKIAISFDYRRKALPRYDVYSLFLMGSSGTIAYSQTSDFDIWICHRPDMNAEQVTVLQRKATLIEQWAGTLDLEVHFFLINPRHFKEGQHADLSKESSGTAQHYLLLEEFYRTGLLLAGRYPLWWLVPPEQEPNYEAYMKTLVEKRYINQNEFIDFGNIAQVPAEEFFGAALWQLFKGIDSPYKSVLKLLLMEIYASQYPNINLLCQRFKMEIYSGETSLDRLDPYIMLYRAIEEYLANSSEFDRLDFARRCFYFKVNERLSITVSPRYVTWRRELMQSLANEWGWGGVYLEMLDARSTWKINRVLRERKILVNELTHCYRILSNFARDHAGLMLINQKDITVLGRKLYAAFERKAGKVEIINRGISDNLWEGQVSLHQFFSPEGQEVWALFRGAVAASEIATSMPLKRGRTVSELMVWSYCNGLIDDRSSIVLHTQTSQLVMRELNNMIQVLQRAFPIRQIMETDINDLAHPARVVTAAVFVNIGVDPLHQHTREGRHLTTARTDALNFSGLAENLALTFDQTILSSWKEVLTFRYMGVDGLLNCLSEYLQWAPPGEGGSLSIPAVFCFSSNRGAAISRRIRELFCDVMTCYYGDSHAQAARYVLAVEQTFYVLYLENAILRYSKLGDYEGLMQYLSRSLSVFSPVVIDRYALSNAFLPLIFKLNRPGIIQVVYRIDGELADVYVVDERGSLFNQRIAFYDRKALVEHLRIFFEAVITRQNNNISIDGGDMPSTEIEFYEAVKDERGSRRLVHASVDLEKPVGHYFNIQVIGDASEDDSSRFTIYCNDVEFPGLQYGEDLFDAVAAFMLKQRGSGARYPIYITDIDLPRAVFGVEAGGRIQTVHFLNYKKRIEEQLRRAVDKVTTMGGRR
jgi:adenylate cyclase, class 1